MGEQGVQGAGGVGAGSRGAQGDMTNDINTGQVWGIFEDGMGFHHQYI